MEYTLAIIKPQAREKGYTGAMISQIEKAGFVIQQIRCVHLTKKEAAAFYRVHRERPFYEELCAYMGANVCIPMVLAKENAVNDFREFIGATNPAEAAAGTLRKQFGTSIDHNAIHGSDSPENAATEIAFFFPTQVGKNMTGSPLSKV